MELQGATVVVLDEDSTDADEANSEEKPVKNKGPTLSVKVETELKWRETSNLSYALNIASLGCVPYEQQRWYETEVTALNGHKVINQRRFKSNWAQYTGWCYFFYNRISSWVTDSKSSGDYQRENTKHFDRFVSHVVYVAARQLDWETADGKSEVTQ